MAEFTPGQTKLLNYWGIIQKSVADRVSTSDLWSAVTSAAAAEGYSLSPANAMDMNSLRSLAAGNRNASEEFMAAPDNAALGASFYGFELYAPAPHQLNVETTYLVRFEQNVLENGMPATVWRTDTFRGVLPATKDELMQQLNSDAEQIGEDYNQTHVSIGSVAITVG